MSHSSESALKVRGADGSIDTSRLARVLNVSQDELSAAVGLSGEGSPAMQARLQEFIPIIERATAWTGSPQIAFEWFCHGRIPGFGGKTAKELLMASRGSAVEKYLDRISDGGYA